MARIFLDTIGHVFAGGVSADFIHKSTSGASIQHVNVPLFILMNTCPGSTNVRRGRTLQPRQEEKVLWLNADVNSCSDIWLYYVLPYSLLAHRVVVLHEAKCCSILDI